MAEGGSRKKVVNVEKRGSALPTVNHLGALGPRLPSDDLLPLCLLNLRPNPNLSSLVPPTGASARHCANPRYAGTLLLCNLESRPPVTSQDKIAREVACAVFSAYLYPVCMYVVGLYVATAGTIRS